MPRIAYRCSPYYINSALYPVIEYVKRLLRWQPDDTAEARLGTLEAMLGGHSQPLGEAVPLFASLLSLPLSERRYPPLALSPQQQKQQTQDALIAWTLEEAERQPTLVTRIQRGRPGLGSRQRSCRRLLACAWT